MSRTTETLTVRIASGLEKSLGQKFNVVLGAFSSADIKVIHKKTGYTAFVDVEDIGREYDIPISKAAYMRVLQDQYKVGTRSKPDMILVSTGNVTPSLKAILDRNEVRVVAAENAVPLLTQEILSRAKTSNSNHRVALVQAHGTRKKYNSRRISAGKRMTARTVKG